MENTKNWKDIYEDYKIACAKPSIFAPQYKGYKEKIKKLHEEVKNLWKDALNSLGNEIIRFDGLKYYFCRIKEDGGESLFLGDGIRLLAEGKIEEAKALLSCAMVTRLGMVIANHYTDSITEIRAACLGIEMSLEKIDNALCEKIRRLTEESDRIRHRIHLMEDAKEKRYYAPGKLWNQTIYAWRDQELFKVGTEVRGYGKVAKVTDAMLIFDNGRRKSKDNLWVESEFTHAHPEYPRIHC